jgi:hypothetical protein
VAIQQPPPESANPQDSLDYFVAVLLVMTSRMPSTSLLPTDEALHVYRYPFARPEARKMFLYVAVVDQGPARVIPHESINAAICFASGTAKRRTSASGDRREAATGAMRRPCSRASSFKLPAKAQTVTVTSGTGGHLGGVGQQGAEEWRQPPPLWKCYKRRNSSRCLCKLVWCPRIAAITRTDRVSLCRPGKRRSGRGRRP